MLFRSGCGEPRPRGSHRGDVGFSVRCGNGACAPRAGAPISDPARWCSSNGHAGSETGAPQFGRSRRLQAAGTGSEFSSAAIWSRHRGAMSAISRGSRSGATIPPEARQIFATPGGVAASSVRGLASFQDAAASRRDSGGVARAQPPANGWKASGLPAFRPFPTPATPDLRLASSRIPAFILGHSAPAPSRFATGAWDFPSGVERIERVGVRRGGAPNGSRGRLRSPNLRRVGDRRSDNAAEIHRSLTKGPFYLLARWFSHR